MNLTKKKPTGSKFIKFRLGAAVAVFLVLVPAMAIAASPFTDITPGKFYEEPVQWAFDNGITIGRTDTTFEPNSTITRGESVTFLKRFNDNVIKQTVGALSCTSSQVAVFDGTNWACGNDQTIADTNTDALGALSCSSSQVAVFDGTSWACGNDQTGAGTNTDVLGGLSCSSSQVAVSDGTSWACGNDQTGAGTNTDVLGGLSCSNSQVAVFDGTNWACGDDQTIANTDVLGGLSCTGSQVAVFDGTSWACGNDQTIANTDVLGGLSCTSSQVAVFDGTSWACGNDQTIANTDTLATLSCTTSQVARFDGSGWVCNTIGLSFKLGAGTSTTVDNAADVGGYSSVAIGTADGFPIISYYDNTNKDLKAYHCSTANCTAGNAVTLDSTGDVGSYSSVAIGDDGFPIISYYYGTNTDLKVYHCTTVTCADSAGTTAAGSAIVLDFAGDVGSYTSVAIGTADGFPIISYYDATNTALKAIHCTTASCATSGGGAAGDAISLDVGSVGGYTSVAIGTADGFPIISYTGATNTALKAYHCTTATCADSAGTTAAGTGIVLDSVSTGSIGLYTSVAIGTDGFPIISYQFDDSANPALKAYHCTTASCADSAGTTAAGTVITLDSTGIVGSYTSVAIGSDGFPIISYRDNTSTAVKLYHCSTASCANSAVTAPAGTVIVLDSTDDVGLYTSVAIGTDNFPIVTYYDITNTALKVAIPQMSVTGIVFN